ncbi:GNAT family N-acetyltransferase [Oceanospirillum sediminis]|uniref:GNAT family N-acetyltransferase n=1 Tax=Oceanospirillum sediminis TaxID=2760088 RepID=A0A839IP82_9GAMM|nr:GNAT family N-acetyltransferase [Oceanospirillum sediminis]MBB1486066.1 GNAT family N-acetyltransferase [Oceanospirillum sediminis]
MSKLTIRELMESDWRTYRELRLWSLQDSPDAFDSTYEEEEQWPDDIWRSGFTSKEGAALQLPLIAELNGIAIGLAWGVVADQNDQQACLNQMWVSPSARGMGIGHKLMLRVIDWAKDLALDAIVLSVPTSNPGTMHFYRAAGFQPNGERTELREGTELTAQPMRLELYDDAA